MSDLQTVMNDTKPGGLLMSYSHSFCFVVLLGLMTVGVRDLHGQDKPLDASSIASVVKN
jgi:hypothetical protein